MPRLSDIIEEFIKGLLRESEKDMLEIQRNELASHFGCAPSQINYVLMTRFTVDKGYYIESKRGGGGSIRITRASIDNNEYFRSLISGKIGLSITQNTAESYINSFLEHKLITQREASIMKVVVNDKIINLPTQDRDVIRANILKSMMIVLVD